LFRERLHTVLDDLQRIVVHRTTNFASIYPKIAAFAASFSAKKKEKINHGLLPKA
jgi:hypothetical protein